MELKIYQAHLTECENVYHPIMVKATTVAEAEYQANAIYEFAFGDAVKDCKLVVTEL